MNSNQNEEPKKINIKRGICIVSHIIVFVELLVIILIVYNNAHSATLEQRKSDQDFIQLLNLSNDALQNVQKAGDSHLKYNMLYTAASNISSAYSLASYTSYSKENLGYASLLDNYRYAFINVSLEKLIANNKTFFSYMQDILKNPHSKSNIEKFNTFLVKFQQDVSNLK